MGCTWWTYNNSQGEITFPTCPYQGDPVNFLSAGVAAAQNMTSKSSTVDLVGKQFKGLPSPPPLPPASFASTGFLAKWSPKYRLAAFYLWGRRRSLLLTTLCLIIGTRGHITQILTTHSPSKD